MSAQMRRTTIREKMPRRLLALRRHLRLVFGRGRYAEAHQYAARVYAMEQRRRDDARERTRT